MSAQDLPLQRPFERKDVPATLTLLSELSAQLSQDMKPAILGLIEQLSSQHRASGGLDAADTSMFGLFT